MARVSVIIPVFNGERTIGAALEALLAQDYPHKEIIVVDDGSVDRTGEIVRKIPDVTYVLQANAGPAAARNAGARLARGEIICFTDADCIPHSDWLTRLVGAFAQADVAAVAGSYGIANKNDLLAVCIHEEIMFRHARFVKNYVRAFGSYNCAIRKKVFDAVGGFDEHYRGASGEDNDLSYKILKAGQKIFFDKGALVDHHHPARLKNYLRSQFQHGFWRAKMYRDHPEMSGGDDYTFWKDMAEVAIVLLILAAVFLSVMLPGLLALVASSLIVLSIMEISFALIILKKLPEALYFAFVMFLRSFARTIGFLTGALRVLFAK